MKRMSIFKRLLILVLVFILSINSFAAIVADNDGATFITKAEFDSLKNNFQAQIDNYNISIDSKIEGAIASYLAGIKIGTPPTDLWAKVVNSMGQKLNFRGSFFSTTSTNTCDTYVTFTRYNDIYENITFDNQVAVVGASGDKWHQAEVRFSNGGYVIHSIQANASGNNDWQVLDTYINNNKSSSWQSTNSRSGTYSWQRYQVSDVASSNGSGSKYIFHMNPDGKKYLTQYASKYCTTLIAKAVYKNWSKKSTTDNVWGIDGSNKTLANLSKYVTDGTRSDTSSKTIDCTTALTSAEKYTSSHRITGATITNIKLDSYDSADNKSTTRSGIPLIHVQAKGGRTNTGAENTAAGNTSYWGLTYGTNKVIDGVDYSLDQWGYGSSSTLYVQEDIEQPIFDSNKSNSISSSNFYSVYGSYGGWMKQTNTLGQITFKYPSIKFYDYSLKASSFTNTYLSAVAGETVYIGGGCPLAQNNNEDGSTMKIEIGFQNVSGASSTDNIRYIVSDKQFKEGSVASGAKTFASGTVRLNSTDAAGNNLTLNLTNLKKNDIIWINIYDDTNKNAVVTISKCKIK